MLTRASSFGSVKIRLSLSFAALISLINSVPVESDCEVHWLDLSYILFVEP